ncbi:aminotransferase class I/II-fold pyridoxal phosphate-dependent enzyme [Baekduia soli]|uniref:Aminotransferase class I/II-fold pyridoxal phosphate-dependent enzyme n=1 Tax=Baekduia soli TaxID=496014 RepID=A0A5B8U7R8_9ACTN|nr:aminotransferase class I/II-fold pyridoxal phosphate-dependent enzyme [Baekduia soli]QEC48975.1 aminotransferase class I/II-fold pyridoxal phosphate-dependent enzyme [Baekduia soli]
MLADLGTYPFVRLDEARAGALARGIELIDFGMGEPREVTPEFIRRALAAAIEPVSTYPKAVGMPELRAAIARWIERRFGVVLDPDREVVPTLGSKEAIFHLAQVAGGDAVAVTTPGYPVAARGARFAGMDVLELALDPARGHLPDLGALDPARLDRLAVLWLNYPNNPTGATIGLDDLERAAALARRHDFVLACDEAYSELWFEGPPPASALQLADRTNVVVLNTLSKRSSMPGYRSGFMAGDPELIAALRRYRPNVGVAPQDFVQRASIAAWDDDAHVEEVRERYRAKRDALLPALQAAGFTSVGGPASFFLWLRTPGGEDEEACAMRLLESGIVCAPGSFFGAGGAGHVRFALVPTPEACARAAARLG